jgi:hypothetical protein
MKIRYVEGMKYWLPEDVMPVKTPITGVRIEDKFFNLAPDGTLRLFGGFAWNGASGPTFDTKSSIGPSAVHDAFCWCMRDGRLDYDKWQDRVNEFFRQQCIEDGMWEWRAGVWHAGVEIGDAGNPDQGPDRRVLEAP